MTAIAPTSRTPTPPGTAALGGRRHVDAHRRRGIQHWIRAAAGVVAGLAFMIMLVVLFGFLFGGAMSVPGGGNYLEFLMPGMFVMTMAFGIGETMAFMAADAERGVTDRFRSMPMAASAVRARPQHHRHDLRHASAWP